MFYIVLSPQRSDAALVVDVAGDAIVIDGQTYDFSSLQEGQAIPVEEHQINQVCSPIERKNGVIHLSLILPYKQAASALLHLLPPLSLTSGVLRALHMSKLQGRFVLFPGRSVEDGGEIVIRNQIVNEGEEAFLKMLLRDDQTIVAGGGNFYIGLCDQIPTDATTLTDLASEPAVSHGYARNAIVRSAVGWPTIALSGNGDFVAQSAVVNFTAAGGDFSGPISRCFLCNVGAGSAGNLFSVSAPLPAAITILSGQTIPIRYELILG